MHVRRQLAIAVVKDAIIDPLPDIAHHAIESELVGSNEQTGAVGVPAHLLPQLPQSVLFLPMS